MFAACSSASRARDASSPSASIGPGVERLAGRWQGTLYETGGHMYQGFSTIAVFAGRRAPATVSLEKTTSP